MFGGPIDPPMIIFSPKPMVPAMQLPPPRDPINERWLSKRKEVIQTSKGYIGGPVSNPWLRGRESHLQRMVAQRPSDAYVQGVMVNTV